MIGLLVAIEGSIAGRWLDFSDPVSLSWRFSTVAARTVASGSDLLCVGDSLAKHGVIPSLIEAESGLRTVNLAAARYPTVMTYFVLRRALDAGAHPKAIIINTKQAVLLGSPDYNGRYWPAVLSPRECLELGLVSRRPETAAAAFIGCLLPSVRSASGDPIEPARRPGRTCRLASRYQPAALEELDRERRCQRREPPFRVSR